MTTSNSDSLALSGAPSNTPDRHIESVSRTPSGAHQIPRRGMPLGLRLGLSVAITVTLVLGLVSGLQQRREMRRVWNDREALLEESLAPLAESIDAAQSLEDIRSSLYSFQQAYVWRGHPDHQVRLRDDAGKVVASSLEDSVGSPPGDALQARVRVDSPLLPGGTGELEVWQNAGPFRAEAAERWRHWWLNIALTAVIIIASVQLAIYILISRPLGILVRALDKMEMGYLGHLAMPRGAWEVRWLAARLERTALELQQSVRRLVAAERRALSLRRPVTDAATVFVDEDAGETTEPVPEIPIQRRLLVGDYLKDMHRLLTSLHPSDPAARALALEVWDRTVYEAEKVGAMGLKAELEDATLRILEPEAFAELETLLKASEDSRRAWLSAHERTLKDILDRAGVPVVAMQHRLKHIAGIWRKMQEKQLDLEQVQDAHAVRVIVPEEHDCYLVLHAVHGAYDPEPFRFKDYIANPKSNGYRSLHTTVRDAEGRVFEIQIRSRAMHREAEAGDAAHWRYKVQNANHTRARSGRIARLVDRARRSLPGV